MDFKKLIKPLIAEAIGTFVLVFCACGVAAFTGGNLVATSLTFGLVIVAMAYSIGRISGCHINPAVSFAMFLSKKMKWYEMLFYFVAQFAGGLLGGIVIFGIAKIGGYEIGASMGDACNYVVGWNGSDITFGGLFGAIATEIILTFIFVYVILNVTDENNNVSKKAGLIIGLTLTLVHLIGICLTGTSVNPARSFATAFAKLIYTGEVDALTQVGIFLFAPMAGGAAAALAFKALHKEKKSTEEAE